MMSPLLHDAFRYAADAHAGQVRKGTQIPYFSHLVAVAALVLEAEGDDQEVIAALLHDVVEDQGGVERLQDVRERFGPRVAMIVHGCSDTDVVPKPPWRERKEAYLRHLKDADPSVLLVSNADKLHNARAILTDYRQLGNELWDRFSAGPDEQLWYYDSLVDVYLQRSPRTWLAEELAAVVGELKRLVSNEGGR